MDQLKNVCHRLSLRKPQEKALSLLADIVRCPAWHKKDADALLHHVRTMCPSFASFDREFPSFCFALATGVGKTRLMGAFIAWLHLEHGLRNFFVLAPNLTIYQKLRTDFTPGTPKYVFRGIGEFARKPPFIITGDDFAENPYVRGGLGAAEDNVRINIFNIDKMTARVANSKLEKDDARRSLPRCGGSPNIWARAISSIWPNWKTSCCLWTNPTATGPRRAWRRSTSFPPAWGWNLRPPRRWSKASGSRSVSATSCTNTRLPRPSATASSRNRLSSPARTSTRPRARPKSWNASSWKTACKCMKTPRSPWPPTPMTPARRA